MEAEKLDITRVPVSGDPNTAPVLVTYASAAGSTKSVAEAIAAELNVYLRDKHRVDCLEISSVQWPGNYHAVILGSAIHNQSWLSPATKFVRKNSGKLYQMPFYAFSVGAPAAMPGWTRRMGILTAEKEKKEIGQKIAELVGRDVQHELFNGVTSRASIGRLSGWCFTCFGYRFGDYRDFTAIKAYAKEIVDDLDRRGIPC